MFSKILIANRGEIACRIIRTARAMGIRTVAVCSEADRHSLHAQMADQCVTIGGPAPADSYLCMERIVEACRQTGAEAVHPGYGFLSENGAFCRLLEQEGIVFVGPPARAIEVMGDKITSKELACRAGVPTIPGHDGVLADADEAVRVAARIGYPVMLKASAGGGGKGMRIARNETECREGFARASGEAASAFGDDRLLIEKYIEQPRHIEIQIMADAHGNVIHLGERECSLQRRHQKVIEESPSPLLDPATRQAMGAQAVALARAVDYTSAGTVEFIVTAQQEFFFLEMNTRLQVEHPVTEMVTGLDLVELMLRVAAGEPLPLTQEEVRQNGWALEARVYAEDPERDFFPSTGRLVRYRPPADEPGRVRVETGVREGDEISIYYDPMIAKLVTWGRDRNEAVSAMQEALDEYVIDGLGHNTGFLSALVGQERFQSGELHTGFIEEVYPEGFRKRSRVYPEAVIVVAAIVHRLYMDRAARISGQLPGHERRVGDDWVVVTEDGTEHEVRVCPFQADCGYRVHWGGREYRVLTDWSFCQDVLRATIDTRRLAFQIRRTGIGYRISHRGETVQTLVLSPKAAALYRLMPRERISDTSRCLLSPMPGLLVKLAVQEGERVSLGQELAVVEAMKMENVLRAEVEGVVKTICCRPGDSLSVDQVILEFDTGS